MKTSNYILELIISGFSAIIWLGLLMLCFIKFPIETLAYLISNQHSESFLLVLAFILFPLIYILGIVFDRFVDIYLDKWFYHKYVSIYFDTKEDLLNARSHIYIMSEPIKDLFEYSKIRIRILRSWIVSSLLIALILPFTIIRQYAYFELGMNWNDIVLLIILVIFFLFNSFITFKAWVNLSKRECYLLKTQSDILKEFNEN